MANGSMNHMLSMIHTTCRERFMRNEDPNVASEQLLWVAGDVKSSTTIRKWDEMYGIGEPLVVPDSVTTGAALDTLPTNNLRGVGAISAYNLRNTMMVRDMVEFDEVTGALYLRLLVWYPYHISPTNSSYKAVSPILKLLDSEGTVLLSVDAPYPGQNPKNFWVRVTYVDTQGLTQTYDLKPTEPWTNNWGDIRLVIPKTAPAFMAIASYTDNSLNAEYTFPAGVGFGATADMKMSLFSADGLVPSGGGPIRINRIGIGTSTDQLVGKMKRA